MNRRLWLLSEPYLYAAPSLLLIAIVMLVPLVTGISYAFHDIILLDPLSGDFIGLDHFRELIADDSFWTALVNTIAWTSVSVALQFGLGLALALLLNRPLPGRRGLQALIFLPWTVPGFLSGLTWAWLFNPVIGPLPHWLAGLGILTRPENILSDPHLALWGPITANVWWGIPFFAITLMAALQSIPRDLYEAASIDGASAWRQFRHITLPLLAPAIFLTVMMRTVWIANFAELIIVMTKGGPADATQTLASYIFTLAFSRLDFGYASAVSLVLMLLLLAYAGVVILLRRNLAVLR